MAARKKERQNQSQSNPRNASGRSSAAAACAARDGMVHSLRGFRSRFQISFAIQNSNKFSATFSMLVLNANYSR
jgi:hypothetical protein